MKKQVLAWVFVMGFLASPRGRADETFKPEVVTFKSGSLELEGRIYRPTTGKGPFPLFVYNHGSEKEPGMNPPSLRYLVEQGFVVFVPVRRGHGKSQGPYFRDPMGRAANEDERETIVIGELVSQVDDVVAGMEYAKKLDYVDAKRVVVGGCSFGGIETLLTVERKVGVVAAVDWAGASMSWAGNPKLQQRLIEAVGKATAPIFFLQAENDFNTAPTKVLSAEAAAKKKPHLAKIFPPHGKTPKDGHGGFCARSPEEWGPDVMAFLTPYLER